MGQHRRLYNTKQWKRLRREQLQKEPLCKLCQDRNKLTPAKVVDHVIPHRGNVDLFFRGQLQSLCSMCHDKAKQIQERHGVLIGGDENGNPTDPNHHWNQ